MKILHLMPPPFEMEVRFGSQKKTNVHAVVAFAVVEKDNANGEKENRLVSVALTRTTGFVFIDQEDPTYIGHHSDLIDLFELQHPLAGKEKAL